VGAGVGSLVGAGVGATVGLVGPPATRWYTQLPELLVSHVPVAWHW